ncbi:MAG: helix-turn-helix transcriptional regulator [Cyclobacteriaceae bacterium]|nr:helix-turn-helix transcriptional regulator [Cyclobacteriaceae bacterium]
MEIIDIYEEVFETFSEFRGDIIEEHINQLRDLDKILPPSSTFFCVTNTAHQSFEFVSKNFEYITGLSKEEMYNGGMAYWWSRFHQDEIQTWLRILKELMIFTMGEVEMEKRKRLSYVWNFRVKANNGNYLNIVQHTSPLYFDDQGKPIIGLAHFSVFGIGEAVPLKATTRYLNDNNIYETIYHQNFSQKLISDNLSNRERDILRLLVLGKSTEFIADRLNLSLHTVYTHRKNILAKSNCHTTNELVANFIQEGFY